MSPHFWIELPYSTTGFLAALDGFDTTTDDAEVVYADDVMHAFTHKEPSFVVEAVRFYCFSARSGLRTAWPLFELWPWQIRKPYSPCEA